jgi:hypothetical protein
MKQGKYFRIPQNPADLEQLWNEAEPLNPTKLPAWLTPEDVDDYRYVGSASWPMAAAHGHDGYFAELEELKDARLILDEDPADPTLRYIYMEQPKKEPIWSIGIYRGPSPFNLAPPPDIKNPVLTAGEVTDTPATFLADPFMLNVDGTWHMFFEVMNWRTQLGEIGRAVSQDGIKWTYQQIVLADDFHFSYPYIFRWLNDYYMIPETYQAGAVRLYKAVNFPAEWSFIATIMTGPYLVDPSVFRHDGRWWMFVDTSSDQRHDTLRLYHAEALTGPWVEHPRSPIIQGDPVIARPAGRVLVINDKVIRFAQSAVPYYGTEVRAFEIDELTTTSYREREVVPGPILRASGAGWNGCGMHHLDAHYQRDGSWLACVDGWVHEPILHEVKSQSGHAGGS